MGLIFTEDIDGYLYTTVVKQKSGKGVVRRQCDPDTVVLHNSPHLKSHFIIHRNGLIEHRYNTGSVLNTKDPYNCEIMIKIVMGDTEQDYCTPEQTASIMYLTSNIKEECYDICNFESEVKGINPEFFRRMLELC